MFLAFICLFKRIFADFIFTTCKDREIILEKGSWFEKPLFLLKNYDFIF